jgi:hypothetical protein
VFEAIRQDEGIADHMMDQPLVQSVPSPTSPGAGSAAVSSVPIAVAARPQQGPIHVQMDEKLVATLNRDGGLENLEVKGELTLRVTEADCARIRLALTPVTDANVQFKTHPHVDKNAWASQFAIATKDPSKPFPLNTPTPVLKYRYVSKDESMIPLAVNFWPTPSGSGTLDCSVEYELMSDRFELRDVIVSIPLP